VLPIIPEKIDYVSVVTAKKMAAFYKANGKYSSMSAPQKAVICYQSFLKNHVEGKYKATRVDGHISNTMLVTNRSGEDVAFVSGFGIGAPAVAIYMENLIEWGVKEFVAVGITGAINKQLKIGDILLCDRAIRDEGVSHHYLARDKYVSATSYLTERFASALKNERVAFSQGATWTTSAAYRETDVEIKQYQEEGVLAVEMENAAVFAVAKYHNVAACSLHTISDLLSLENWEPHFSHKSISQKLNLLVDIAINH